MSQWYNVSRSLKIIGCSKNLLDIFTFIFTTYEKNGFQKIRINPNRLQDDLSELAELITSEDEVSFRRTFSEDHLSFREWFKE